MPHKTHRTQTATYGVVHQIVSPYTFVHIVYIWIRARYLSNLLTYESPFGNTGHNIFPLEQAELIHHQHPCVPTKNKSVVLATEQTPTNA